MPLIVVTDLQTAKLSVNCNEISSSHRLHHKVQLFGEVSNKYFHFLFDKRLYFFGQL